MGEWVAAGGWTVVACLALSVLGWWVVFERWWALRRAEGRGPQVGAGRSPRQREVALEREVRLERVRLRGQLALADVCARLCPMLGLLGTVLGLMAAFEGLAGREGAASAALAGGISQALISTEVGLVLALPLLLAHGHVG